MMPPELLHTSGSGLIMYMFESLRDQMGGGKDRDPIDRQHILISNLIKRQSERDFSRGSMRNSLIDGTKCQSPERKENLFRQLCIANTTNGSHVMKRSLKYSGAKWKQYIEFLKQYLCMEEWFHDSNNKVEVVNARPQIVKVLQSLQQVFPRNTNTNGYNLPKMHGITKMQEYMKLFGSGINFSGGPGESAHKQFIKIPGQRTQRRVSEFAQQTALQYYSMLVSSHAAHDCQVRSNSYKQSRNTGTDFDCTKTKRDVLMEMSGKYDFTVTREVIEMMEAESKVIINWSYDYQIAKGSSEKFNLNKDYVKVLHKRLCSSIGTIATGFMKATITLTPGECTQLYAHPCFQGHQWYDWALVHFQEVNNQGEQIENHYPSKILGFLAIVGKH
jgi:hypothetical protein